LHINEQITRKAVEEKQRRKEEKKASTTTKVVHDENSEVAGSDSEGPTFGVATVNARTLTSSTKEEKSSAEKANVGGQHGTEEGDSLGLINHGLPNLKSVLDLADVVVEVLDARDPLSFRSAHLEELAAARPAGRTLLVLNKIGEYTEDTVCFFSSSFHHIDGKVI
jgi:nuclear GTP-binding protein